MLQTRRTNRGLPATAGGTCSTCMAARFGKRELMSSGASSAGEASLPSATRHNSVCGCATWGEACGVLRMGGVWNGWWPSFGPSAGAG